MDKQFYFLSPVEVVKVTDANLEEVASWCGGKVAETESRRVPGRLDKYVWVPTPKGSAISWAFPGMFITKRLVVTEKNEIKSTYAVFRRDYFSKNYFETPNEAVDKTWERELKEHRRETKRQQKVEKLIKDGQVNLELKEAMEEAFAGMIESFQEGVREALAEKSPEENNKSE